MSEEKKVFCPAFRVFAPRDGRPDFILGTLVIDVNSLFTWLKGEGGQYITEYQGNKQVKFEISTNKSDGRINFKVDTWKPTVKSPEEIAMENAPSDDLGLPF